MTNEKSLSLDVWGNTKTLTEIKNIYGKNLSNEEFKTFLLIGKSTGLNPFLREIWAVKYKDRPANVFIGRDGYRRSAQAQKEYDYHQVDAVYSSDEFIIKDGQISHTYNMNERGELRGAYCVCKKKNSEKPFFVFVEFREYTTGMSLWKTKPATMIKKVAEAQCLKMAFQEIFKGTYEESEKDSMDEPLIEESEINSTDEVPEKAFGQINSVKKEERIIPESYSEIANKEALNRKVSDIEDYKDIKHVEVVKPAGSSLADLLSATD